ncbi:MAG: Peroxiredoxin [uncultured Thiotrichaceae bacterium]|uniref:Peroxiredoxin n=1 Tax=uncultured Thiotrichaceae bacterium TaxID=298394 RepID=A0A6S6TY73_9GAMM|nr:MAG: Peroxiredoxin [uncultured Thiotrichaceae bacterium]
MHITKHIIALITSLTLFVLSTSAIAMTDMNGTPAQLQSMVGKGKWTIAKVWAHDCHACHRSIHYLSQFKQRFPEADIFGISVDGQDGKQKALGFINRFKLTFPNLLSDAMELDNYLYAKVGETLVGTPTIIVYDPQGKIAAVQPGAVTPNDLIGFIKSKEAEAVAAN